MFRLESHRQPNTVCFQLLIAYFWLRMGVLLHTLFGWQPSSTVESFESWSSLYFNRLKFHKCTCIIRSVHQFSSIVAPKIGGTCLAHVYLQFTTFAHTKQTQHSCKKKIENLPRSHVNNQHNHHHVHLIQCCDPNSWPRLVFHPIFEWNFGFSIYTWLPNGSHQRLIICITIVSDEFWNGKKK